MNIQGTFDPFDPSKGGRAQMLGEFLESLETHATKEEVELANRIHAKALEGKRAVEIVELSPAVCAILLRLGNGRNRKPKLSMADEYARRIRNDEWRFTNAALGFYITGILADGQHRLLSNALAALADAANKPILVTVMVYGLIPDFETGAAIDDGRARTGADAVRLVGVNGFAEIYSSTVKSASKYMGWCGNPYTIVSSHNAVATAILKNKAMLELAVSIADESATDPELIPILKPSIANPVAYLMLQNGWTAEQVAKSLKEFQITPDVDEPKTPYQIVAKEFRKRTYERLSSKIAIALVLYAVKAVESGETVYGSKNLRERMKKMRPSPNYPNTSEEA